MRKITWIAFFIFAILLGSCSSCNKAAIADVDAPAQISGSTMGTTYLIKVEGDVGTAELTKLKVKIAQRLSEINNQMSTYIPKSNISQFNKAVPGEKHRLPKDMQHVVSRAMHISAWTGGAYDITLDPLVNLWGFDKNGRVDSPPSEQVIAAAKAKTGHEKLEYVKGKLSKLSPGVSINLSGIAKGFAVDAISELLVAEGIFDFMVEIGGEIRVSRQNPDAKPWKIGIASPLHPDIRPRPVGILPLKNGALATSGVGLNSFRYGGKNYTHILDPSTGHPVQSDLASVAVVAPDCTTADALSTSAIVMGEERFRKMISTRPGIEALFIYLNPAKDSVRMSSTGGFQMK